MSSPDEQHISERRLVRDAAINPVARKHLMQELLPYVTRATKKLMKSRGIPELREQELVEVGMAAFDRVFNIYLKNAADHNEYEGYFYDYYIWWMRKVIYEHLHAETIQCSHMEKFFDSYWDRYNSTEGFPPRKLLQEAIGTGGYALDIGAGALTDPNFFWRKVMKSMLLLVIPRFLIWGKI